jgi:CBS domain-containing protein
MKGEPVAGEDSRDDRRIKAEGDTMKIKDVMTKTPAFCNPETNLGAAVETMWNRNCGFLPVVDAQRHVVGVVTDRDIAIAVGTQNRFPGEITVGEIATRKVHSSRPEYDIHMALDTMAENKVRRLVVVNEQNQFEGVLSMDDVVLFAETMPGGKQDLSSDDVLRTLKTLYGPQLLPRTAAATA